MTGIDLSTLNEEQRRIATTLDHPIFVEAGAGSGKTFTLTRRIAWALSPGSGTDGHPFVDDLSQVLVITFTNAAAREIRERVRSTLRDAGMREASLQVDSAWISTIHGMCTRILKRHAFDLGLDPDFRVASTNEQTELYNRALNEVVGDVSHDPDKSLGLRQAFDEYEMGTTSVERKASGLLGIVDSIRSAACASAGGFGSLVVPPAADVSDVMHALYVSYGSLQVRGLSKAAGLVVAASLDALEGFERLAPGERTAEAAAEVLSQVKFPHPSNALAEFLPEAKGEFALARAEVVLGALAPAASELIALAERFDARYMELKQERSLLDNDDLIRLALRAVRDNPSVAADYAGRFRLVMVDEFQDTDAQQLELISILSGGSAEHLATVGDAQQSIYRFRGADVTVFRARGASLPADDHIRLAVNYRSHADVLAFVDRVCGGERGVVDGFMHLDPDAGRADGYAARALPRVDVELTVGTSRISQTQVALTAAAIADRLAGYRDAGEDVGDMALLLGATTHADYYIDAMRARGLECVVTGGSTFTGTSEALTMGALLHYLANDRDTQSGLFPLLTSEMFDLDANDFVQLGTRTQSALDAPAKRDISRGMATMAMFRGAPTSARLAHAHEVLTRARSLMRRRPVADVCLQVVRDSGWLERLERQGGDGRAREANVLAAIGYIRDLTSELGLGPGRAATEYDIWLGASKIPPASLAGGRLAAVRVMTIHASKGLEFPVVAVAECWRDPRADTGVVTGRAADGSVPVVLVPPGGAGKLDDPHDEEDHHTLAEWYAHLRSSERAGAAAEKTRLLYVALTRAREAIVMGVRGCETKDAGLSPVLSARVCSALFEGDLPPVGESGIGYGGSEPARVRRIDVRKQDPKDKGTSCMVADSAGTLAGVDGVAITDPSQAPFLGCSGGGPLEAEFALYPSEADELTPATVMRRPRADVFSYSSAHAQMERERAPASECALPTRAERDADQTGAPTLEDGDKATNLGSAFHELAQVMVESGVVPSQEHVRAMEGYWRLSSRASAKLEAALARWRDSDIRREAIGHGLVRAEVPFFSAAESRFGSYVEGAIDLLATDAGSSGALVVDYKTGDVGLSMDQIRARHEMQANFYASVLMRQGFSSVECAFVCVELDDGNGQPVVVRYEFGEGSLPRMG